MVSLISYISLGPFPFCLYKDKQFSFRILIFSKKSLNYFTVQSRDLLDPGWRLKRMPTAALLERYVLCCDDLLRN